MKKVININFQGRVVPIEETAYEMLQNYISSLRAYFANEEGRDEIINDIENRIGELFGDTLKKGAACITDADVEKVIASVGRPEDFAADDATDESSSYSSSQQNTGNSYQGSTEYNFESKRLYRNESDKLLAGVASGLAQYLKLDPSIVRFIFILLVIFGGSGILIYIILWIVLPSRSLVSNIRKRLYRDPDDKVISGVCGGLGKYFDINPAIPRVIFAAPFIFGIITSIGRNFFDDGPFFVGSFGGSTFILVYVILWIVLPEAITASEKLEMRGEKVDLNSIRDTVMNDLHGMKGRAQKVGAEVKATATQFGTEVKETFQQSASNIGQDIHQSTRRRGGIGHAIATIVKAFVYLILGAIGVGLFVALIALLGSGVSVLPLHDFILQGKWQYLFALGTVVLFIGIPIISVLVWFIRRLMKVKSHSKFIGYGFTTLWLLGLFCLVGLLGSLRKSFSSQVGAPQEITIQQPVGKTLEVKLNEAELLYNDNWFNVDGVLSIEEDTMYLNTVKVNVVKSKDSAYHVHLIKISRGTDRLKAQSLAENIAFNIEQRDSVLYLPESFKISKDEKWRNQKVIVVIEVPLNKNIRLDEDVRRSYDYFNIDLGHRRSYRGNWEREWESGEHWDSDRKLKMTEDGLEAEKSRDAKSGEEEQDWEENKSNKKVIIIDTIGEPKAPAGKPSKEKIDTIYRYRSARIETESNNNNSEDATATSGNGRSLPPLASVMKIF
ncbi:MAG TPA: PspC domain-containing protein [Phnomibacter sp.]|nr:PspC domain-containing protein [Phnomibacter sp.]